MFDTYKEAWRAARRWWRQTPLGLKLLTPVILVIGTVFLPQEAANWLSADAESRERKRSTQPPRPTDFWPPVSVGDPDQSKT